MRDKFYHEKLYRGEDALNRLKAVRLIICGAGAVGSNLITTLVRQGFQQITVIDFDRVESHNVGTQAYAEGDVGVFKAEALQAEVFRAVGVEICPVRKRLTEKNVKKLLADADVVIDGFDNHAARFLVTEHCRVTETPCLHAGLSADYAEVMWNEEYRVPHDVTEPDVCDYPMARNLIQFAVTLTAESLVRFVLEGEKQNCSFTLKDLRVNVNF